MRQSSWRLVLLVCCSSFSVAFDAENGRPPTAVGRGPPLPGQGGVQGGVIQQQQQQPGSRPSISGQVAGAAAKVSGWYRAYQGFVSAAAKVNQLISFGCGLWLVMSTPLTFIGASLSVKFKEAALVLFLGMYGMLLLGVEVPLGAVQTMLRQYFFFVYTRPGRAGFVINIALICWICNSVGFITKALMTFNAVLTFYILNSQDRRFAAVDAEAKAALQQASEEMRGSMSEALSFGKMFSGAFGGRKVSSPPPAAPPRSAGGFQQNSMATGADDGNAWPSGSDA